MDKLSKVTDPAKMVTDELVLKELIRQGIDKDYVEFHQDYAPRSLGKEHSPYAKFYRDLKSDKRFMVVSGLPKVTESGERIIPGWVSTGEGFLSRPNLITAIVKGNNVSISFKGKVNVWSPQIFLNGLEVKPEKEDGSLLTSDPVNPHYSENVLEWNYGICKRRLRLIEGAILEYYEFAQDPEGYIVIKSDYSQKDIAPCRQYATDAQSKPLPGFQVIDDEKRLPREAFNNPAIVYPLLVDDSLTVYSSSSDGMVRNAQTDSYANTHDAASGDNIDATGQTFNPSNRIITDYPDAGANYWINRGFVFFDTSSLGAGATISAATCSLCSAAYYQETDAGHPDVELVEGVQDDPLAYDDYGDHLSKTTVGAPILDASANYPADGVYWDFVLDATGRSWISLTATTKFCFRAKGDVDNSQPSNPSDNQTAWYTSEKGTGYKPKLVVTYTTPGWTGTVLGVSNPAAVIGVAVADIAAVIGVE